MLTVPVEQDKDNYEQINQHENESELKIALDNIGGQRKT